MKFRIEIAIIFLFVLSFGSFAQKSKVQTTKVTKLQAETSPLLNGQKLVPAPKVSQAPDYKIINSTSTYIEIEFYPKFDSPSEVTYNGQKFSILSFASAVNGRKDDAGKPDLRSRIFSIIVPSESNNKISVISYDEKDINGVNLAPVPQYRGISKNQKPLAGDYQALYITDSKSYLQNNFLPQSIAELGKSGPVRDYVASSIIIHPYQYNPSTKVVKEFTRIRVRVTFGRSPSMRSKPRTSAEIDLMRGFALNSNVARKWVNPNFRDRVDSVFTSAMATGDWYKIQILDDGSGSSEGIYKMTKSFLQSAGMNLDNIDPRTIKMYGNGGSQLPDDFNQLRPQDLVQIPIYIYGENDGHFDAGDYVLFYAKSVNGWTLDTGGIYDHYVNVYSNSNYYWICLNTSGNGMRMNLVTSPNNPSAYVAPSFRDRQFNQPDQVNVLNEGNIWLSTAVTPGNSFTWNTTMAGLVPNSNMYYRTTLASIENNPDYPSPCPYSINFLINDAATNMSPVDLPLQCTNPANWGGWIYPGTVSFNVNASQKNPPNSTQTSFNANFQCTGSDGLGYMEWMEIQYDRAFNSAANDMMRFDSPPLTQNNQFVQFDVSTFSSSDVKVFDITSHNNVQMIQPIVASASDVRFQMNEFTRPLSSYIVTGPNGYKTPTSISQKVANQNLHGISDGADFIIITDQAFVSAAARLQAERQSGGAGNPNYLKTDIVTCDQIYNEFSGGLLDPVAIRDFIRFAMLNWQRMPSYVMLLGKGVFDYKNHLGLPSTTNWVPAYELSTPDINQVDTYTTDDFFVHVISPLGNSGGFPPDLAIGRVPCSSLQDANGYLDKVVCYENAESNGYWKNRVALVADDGWTTSGDDGNQFTVSCEQLANQFLPPSIDKVKLYLILYPPVITAEGRRKPACNQDIVNTWNQGVLGIQYTGHGSPDVWAHEYVLERDVIMPELNNGCLYPFVAIASCDMSKFDDPTEACASELFVITPNKGAIATLAASRPTYGSQNQTLMEVVFSQIYLTRDTLLLPERFGEAVFKGKTIEGSGYGENDAKFILLGDPTARIDLPRFQTRVDSISGLVNDTMQALSKVKVYGSILNPDSSLWSSYNGQTFVKVYDVPHQIEIDDQDPYPPYEIIPYIFTLQGGFIYNGMARVTNGKWSAEYIVPKDISYLNQPGSIVNYFYNSQADGSGFYNNFYVGGINVNAPNDTTPPTIKLYLNNRNFRSGDVVNENFTLIGDLFDQVGINTTGTIGHKIEATLDGNQSNQYDLTTYYNSDTSYKSGSLSYNFTGVADGKHTLTLRAWDTYDNSAQGSIDFNVISSGNLSVINVYNYPNPFKGATAFTFQHSYPGAISVKIKIYTVAGRLIKEIDNQGINDKFVYIPWDGKDADGETLSNGVYIYRLVVTADNGSNSSAYGKLAVLK